LYNFYSDSKTIYCDPVKLETFFKNNSNYVELNSTDIMNFWPLSSNFLCYINAPTLAAIEELFKTSFTLPNSVKEVIFLLYFLILVIWSLFKSYNQKIFGNDSSLFQSLSKNSTIFTNLNTSTFQVLNANTMTKLNDLFELFAGINANYSNFSMLLLFFRMLVPLEFGYYNFYFLDLPNIFGKSLCGPDFDVRIEDFGYTYRPPPQQLNDTSIPNINYTTTRTTSKSTTSGTTKKPNKEIENLLKSIKIFKNFNSTLFLENLFFNYFFRTIL